MISNITTDYVPGIRFFSSKQFPSYVCHKLKFCYALWFILINIWFFVSISWYTCWFSLKKNAKIVWKWRNALKIVNMNNLNEFWAVKLVFMLNCIWQSKRHHKNKFNTKLLAIYLTSLFVLLYWSWRYVSSFCADHFFKFFSFIVI